MSEVSEGATTGSAVANRLQHKPSTLTKLSPTHRLMVEYLVWGCPHNSLAKRVGHRAGTPLTVDECALVLGMRLRAVRWLSAQPLFQAELARAMRSFRNGQQPASWRKLVELRDDPGQGKAADRKVQLAAALALIGETGEGSKVNVTVNNQVNTAVQLNAGIVIRLPATAPAAPLESQTVEQSVSDESEQ